MTLQQLEYIIALDNHRHFVKAAESCYVTQPTLTMLIQKLEAEIGVKIFDRNSKPLQPTPVGEQILSKARQILREVNYLKAFVSDEIESLEGEFTIGIIPTLAPYLLPLFIAQFVKTHPKTKLKIKELQTEHIIAGINKGTIDLGLVVTPLSVSSIRELPLFNEPFLLYLPENHNLNNHKEIKQSDLDSSEMLLMEEGHCFREQTLAICHNNKKKKTKGFEYESGSIEAMKELVKQGMGYTLVPELSVKKEERSKNVKRFKSPEPIREISIIVHTSFTKEALIEHLHESIVNAVPEQFKKMRKFKRIKWR